MNLRPQSVRNKRNGSDSQRIIARIVGAKNVGTLGKEDLDGGWFIGEVKRTTGLSAWLRSGLLQLDARKTDKLKYIFLHDVRGQGIKSQVYVIQTLEQWIDVHGSGAYKVGE